MALEEPIAQDAVPLMNVSAGLLEDANGKVLLGKRSPSEWGDDIWEFPGGKLEKGELPEVALARELAEELGIVIDIDDLKAITFVRHRYPKFQLCLFVWLVPKWSGSITNLVHEELAWVSYQDLKLRNCFPANKKLFDRMVKFRDAVG